MYCSRRGIEVTKPTTNCPRCGRCNWERQGQEKKGSIIGAVLLLAAVILIAAALLLR